MTLPQNRKRARSDSEKEARRGAILSAARDLIDEVGIDGVTMNALAARAGVSKGTLYLYARSKEEIFLALFVEAMDDVVTRIETQLRDRTTPDTLIDVMSRAPMEVPLFVPLLARLVAVIEANVADGPYYAQKRRMWAIARRVAEVITRQTGAPDDQARLASMSLMLAMQGAAQLDIGARRDLSTVPEDLAPLMAGQGFETTFPPAARLILSGLI